MEDKDCKVGILVQSYTEDGEILDGVITVLTPPKRERPRNYFTCSLEEQEDFKTFATVKYDNGTEETACVWEFSKRDTAIEREFRLAASPVLDKIYAKLEKASKYISEAEAIAEKHGIPFSSNVSPLSQGYRPESFDEKYSDVSNDIMSSVTDCCNEYVGWQHSKVCY